MNSPPPSPRARAPAAPAKYEKTWRQWGVSVLLALIVFEPTRLYINRLHHDIVVRPQLEYWETWDAEAEACHIRGECFYRWACAVPGGAQNHCCSWERDWFNDFYSSGCWSLERTSNARVNSLVASCAAMK
jgi:hypothetical protein